MGYSVRSRHYRYTEWVRFDTKTFEPDWTQVVAKELYNHLWDPEENENQKGNVIYKNVQIVLSKILRERSSTNTH